MATHAIYTEKLVSKPTNAFGGLILLLLVFSVLYQTFVGPIGNNPAPTWTLILMVALFTAVFANFCHLKITLTPESITVGYGVISRKIPWGNIERCHLDQTSALNYGGFGIRIARINGKWRLVYNILGSPRVVLSLTSGGIREFVFSTENPDEVLHIINERIASPKF